MTRRERERRPAMLLGTLIRPARERMDWTQQQLADKVGIDKGYISAIELGHRRWPLEHVEAIAESLGLDLVEMAVASGMLPEKVLQRRTVTDEFSTDDPMRELIIILRNADYTDRKTLLDYAKFTCRAAD